MWHLTVSWTVVFFTYSQELFFWDSVRTMLLFAVITSDFSLV